MKLAPLNTVLLAEDYAKMRDWYVAALGLELLQEWTDDYHYAELVRDGKLVIGIADAKEMGVEPYRPRRNATLLQLTTDDIDALFARVREHGGDVDGPKTEDKGGFRYGMFDDPEGNAVWVVEMMN